jgi:glycosyltransferase involved in cell wall biosynthesis
MNTANPIVKPKVTVAIPAYNAMAYLPATLQSVLQQSYRDFEVIIVNDGSSDEIEQWFTSIKDPRVRLISQTNKGLAGARNTGVKNAIGEYIALLDADDLWEKTKLEKQVKILEENPEITLVYSWASFIDEKGKCIGKLHTWDAEGQIWEKLLPRNPILPSSAIIRLSCFDRVGLFDENLISYIEDWDMWLRITKNYPVRVIKQPLTYYRLRPSSVSKNWEGMKKSFEIAIEKAFTDAPKHLIPVKNISYSLSYLHMALQGLDSEYPDLQKINYFRNLAVTYNPRLRLNWLYWRSGLAIALTKLLGLTTYRKFLVKFQSIRSYFFKLEVRGKAEGRGQRAEGL